MATAFAACALATDVATAARPGLSDEQEQRLAAGEVIVLDALPPGASKSAYGGTAHAVLRAPLDDVWRVLVDYAAHPRFYPGVRGVEVLEIDERHALVKYDVGIGPLSFGSYVNSYPYPIRHRIEWQLATGHANNLFRENSGYWQLAEAEGATAVTYAIAIRVAFPAFVTLGAVRGSLVDAITGLRKLAGQGKGAGTR